MEREAETEAFVATSPLGLRAGPGGACVGPNAVTQLIRPLRERLGEAATREVFAAAGVMAWLDTPPTAMVSEHAAAALFRTLFAWHPADVASGIAAEAGRRTADYLLANRIPGPAQVVLQLLPAALGARLLLGAIARNAWTFAGSGRCRTRPGSPHVIEIGDNPLATPGCVWHGAVFERLFRRLVAPRAMVHHPRCCAAGAAVCRFEIRTG